MAMAKTTKTVYNIKVTLTQRGENVKPPTAAKLAKVIREELNEGYHDAFQRSVLNKVTVTGELVREASTTPVKN